MLRGQLAEMNTGEGKTLTATLPAIAVALSGLPVHVVTVNDYLAERDSAKLNPLYSFFGLRVGLVQEGMDPESRRAGYACDITYCTNKEIAFDYLKDRIHLAKAGGNLRRKISAAKSSLGDQLIMRGLYFAIVDEADSVLIDEARTPLILSAEAPTDAERSLLLAVMDVAGGLEAGVDFEVSSDERSISLLAAGRQKLQDESNHRGGIWLSKVQREELVSKALTALHVMKRNDQYIIRENKVAIVDEYTGRVMADRFWSDGLHQMVELKEGLDISPRRLTIARMTYQRVFRRYHMLSGMSGTAAEIAGELWEVYRLKVVRIPTHKPKRLHQVPDMILPNLELKWKTIAGLTAKLSSKGVPILIGTRSVAASMEASRYLTERGVIHSVLNATNDTAEAELIALAGHSGRVTVATNMAGRGTDIVLGPGVSALGGLVVIISERHDSARIDRQLAGRTARQGEPGRTAVVLSLEDSIFTQFAPAWLAILTRIATERKWQKLAALLMRLPQRRAEFINAQTRRQLLKYDEELEKSLGFAGTSE